MLYTKMALVLGVCTMLWFCFCLGLFCFVCVFFGVSCLRMCVVSCLVPDGIWFVFLIVFVFTAASLRVYGFVFGCLL